MIHVLLAIPLGIAIGLSLGALGGGGSILTVPALVYVLGESATTATAGSLVIVGSAALVGAASHARQHRVRWWAGSAVGAATTSATAPPRWFSIVHRKAIRRGVFRSVPHLKDAIQRFIDSWNARRHPFVWVKTADEILARANQKAISAAVH